MKQVMFYVELLFYPEIKTFFVQTFIPNDYCLIGNLLGFCTSATNVNNVNISALHFTPSEGSIFSVKRQSFGDLPNVF